MDLANMREQGVHHLIAFYLNDACRHQALIDVSSYPPEKRALPFRSTPHPHCKVRAYKGGKDNRADSFYHSHPPSPCGPFDLIAKGRLWLSEEPKGASRKLKRC
jgi:hypothetical protein